MDDLLGLGTQPQTTVTAKAGFGFEEPQTEAGGDDWASMDIFGSSQPVQNEFAKGPLNDVMLSSTPGKNGTTGLAIKGHFFMENRVLMLGLEITNS